MTLEMVYDGQFGSQTTVGSNICDAEGKSFEVMKFSVNVHVPQTLLWLYHLQIKSEMFSVSSWKQQKRTQPWAVSKSCMLHCNKLL